MNRIDKTLEFGGLLEQKHRNFVWVGIGTVLLAWLFIVCLHWGNDGIWNQGDSPRHAANGIFWKDFLLSGSLHPQEYAIRYYARYPDIGPASYPPIFYMLEGTAFLAFGQSPYVAKGLVLVFALLAALYLMAWLKRWLAANTGWEASLLLLLPGFVRWSNAVMLNVPATALSVASLYHSRRWIETDPGPAGRRQLYLAAGFFLAATLTYLPAGIMAAIVLVWMLVARRWKLLWDWRVICVGFIIAALLIPCASIIFKWSPVHVGLTRNVFQTIRIGSRWSFYLSSLRSLVSPFLLVISAFGLAAGISSRRFRQEAAFLLMFLSVAYLALSVLGERADRYGLLLCIPIICYCSMAFHIFSDWLGALLKNRRKAFAAVILSIAIGIFCIQARIAKHTLVPRVEGISDVVAFMQQVAPEGPVFYDGNYDGVFTFYLQASDPGFRRRVVLGSKLLYSSAIMPGWSYRSFVNSVQDVVQALQTRGGCRWLAIEIGEQASALPAARLLREAVQRPEFELIQSFQVTAPGIEHIDVYRFKEPIQPVSEVDMPFQVLGDGIRFKMQPIER
jgi:hypothetical protein